jgi:hypothetical protein
MRVMVAENPTIPPPDSNIPGARPQGVERSLWLEGCDSLVTDGQLCRGRSRSHPHSMTRRVHLASREHIDYFDDGQPFAALEANMAEPQVGRGSELRGDSQLRYPTWA